MLAQSATPRSTERGMSSLIVTLGQPAHEGDNEVSGSWVLNSHKCTVQLKPVAILQEVLDGEFPVGRLPKIIHIRFGHEEIRDWHTQGLSDLQKPAGGNAIDTVFILLDLLKSDIKPPRQVFLA